MANLSREYLNKGAILVEDNPIDTEALRTHRLVYVADQRTDPRVSFPEESAREGIVSALCVPLIYHGRAEGVLRVYMGQRHEFDWFEISLLQAVTQLQEQTLTFVPKIVAMVGAAVFFIPWIAGRLLEYAQGMFGTLP